MSAVESLPLMQFVIAVPTPKASSLVEALGYAYPGSRTRCVPAPDALVVVVERDTGNIVTHVCPRGNGWLVLKGNMHDTRLDRPADASHVLEHFLVPSPDFNRFEGEFAAVVHDANTQVTWAFNDQMSLMHLYIVERDGAIYVTTAPLVTARALGIGLSAPGLREFLVRGQVMCPRSLCAGMSRLSIGEHARIHRRHLQVASHWSAYTEPRAYKSKRAAAQMTANVVSDVARRYAMRGPIVADLSGGYDSRLVASALSRVGARLTVTVNGHREHPDVVIAAMTAQAAGWPLRHYGDAYTEVMTAEERRQATYMSRGELGATSLYLHLTTRPALAKEHVGHAQGGGGELLRSFPWGQEFTGIGRRRQANIDRLLKYRLLTNPALPDKLFVKPPSRLVYEDLRQRSAAIIREGRGTLTTQQLDALYLLRLTGHVGAYTSSLFDLLPTGVPLMQRTVVEHSLSLPWTMRLSAGLLRRTIALLHPQAASVQTVYGAPAAPARIFTLPHEAQQALGRIRHLLDKVDRVVLHGRIGRMVPLAPAEPDVPVPRFRTSEFAAFLDPVKMYSRALYDGHELEAFLSDPATSTEALSRIATVEHVCREINARPGPELLTDP